jgi:DNA-binding transcriptional regulator YhcF (GntR family)
MSQTTTDLEATRERLAELQALDEQHCDQVRKQAAPYAADLEATSRELERLERADLIERTRGQLRGLSAEAKAHDTALKAAVFQGINQLLRTLDQMNHHMTTIRANRRKFYDLLETVTPNVTKEKMPLGLASQEEHDAAQSLLRELTRAGIDLDAILSSSTGYLSPFDTREMLPSGELGGELWDLYITVKQPDQPGSLHKPRRRER